MQGSLELDEVVPVSIELPLIVLLPLFKIAAFRSRRPERRASYFQSREGGCVSEGGGLQLPAGRLYRCSSVKFGPSGSPYPRERLSSATGGVKWNDWRRAFHCECCQGDELHMVRPCQHISTHLFRDVHLSAVLCKIVLGICKDEDDFQNEYVRQTSCTCRVSKTFALYCTHKHVLCVSAHTVQSVFTEHEVTRYRLSTHYYRRYGPPRTDGTNNWHWNVKLHQ